MTVVSSLHTQFASDNTAGIAPEALAAFNAANSGFLRSYGEDAMTRAVCDRIRALFNTDCDVYFVFNGTAANSLALATLTQSYHSVICADVAHVETDECGAPEFFSNGAKLLTVPTLNGKMQPADVERQILKRTDLHHPRARALTFAQTTEDGSVYTQAEIEALCAVAKRHKLHVHLDGARFANAVAALGAAPADLTWRAGVDVLSFGGTKMGLPIGEAVVFFDRTLSTEFNWRCKQAGQLASKMRFLSAPWLAMLENDVWLHHARHANAMAQRLAHGIAHLPGVQLVAPPANAVFAHLSDTMAARLRERGWYFYSFIGGAGRRDGCTGRFMTSWATTPEAVDALIADFVAAAA